MMDFELKLEKPKLSRAWISAATMGFAYFIGTSPKPVVPRFCSSLTTPRWLDTYDPVLRHEERNTRTLRLHRHYSSHP